VRVKFLQQALGGRPGYVSRDGREKACWNRVKSQGDHFGAEGKEQEEQGEDEDESGLAKRR
jgi:hypothetical protein